MLNLRSQCAWEGPCDSLQCQCFFHVMGIVSASLWHGAGVGWPSGGRELISGVGGVVVTGGFPLLEVGAAHEAVVTRESGRWDGPSVSTGYAYHEIIITMITTAIMVL